MTGIRIEVENVQLIISIDEELLWTVDILGDMNV